MLVVWSATIGRLSPCYKPPLPCCASQAQPTNGVAPSFSLTHGHVRTGDTSDVACVSVLDQSTGRTEVASCVRSAQVRDPSLDLHLFKSVGDRVQAVMYFQNA